MAGKFSQSRQDFRYNYSEICARDYVNGHKVVLTVTVIGTESRKCPMATPIFIVTKCTAPTKTLKNFGTVRVSQKKKNGLVMRAQETSLNMAEKQRKKKHDRCARSKFAYDTQRATYRMWALLAMQQNVTSREGCLKSHV